MTITAMAKQLGVSTMTIYRRCEKNSVNIKDLRDDASGELTAEGVAVIASLFDTTSPQTAITDDTTRLQRDTQTASQAEAAATIAVLQAKLEGVAELVSQLTGERDSLREQLAAAQAALAAEQADRQAERRLLTGSVDDGQMRKGFFRRLFHR